MQRTMRLVDDKALRRLKNSGATFNEASKTFLEVASNMVVGKAKEKAPARDGQLRQSIQAKKPKKRGSEWSAKVGSGLEYAKYQEFGTGIHGPKRRRIYPKRAKVLAWRNKKGEMIFARSVAGVPKQEFMKKGIEAVKKNIRVAFDRMDKIIQSKL